MSRRRKKGYRTYKGNIGNHIIPYFREKGIKLHGRSSALDQALTAKRDPNFHFHVDSRSKRTISNVLENLLPFGNPGEIDKKPQIRSDGKIIQIPLDRSKSWRFSQKEKVPKPAI